MPQFPGVKPFKKNGKTYYRARFTDPLTGKQKELCAKTAEDAYKRKMDIHTQINTGCYVTPNKLRLSDYMKEWLERKKPEIESGTWVSYESINRLYITPQIGRVYMSDVRRMTFQSFIDKLSKNGSAGKGKPLSASYIHNIAGTLSAAMTDAFRDELIPKNYAEKLRLPKITFEKPVAMQDDARKAFEAAIAESPYRIIFTIMLEAGLRVSEALGLKWDNINFDTGHITIDGQLERQRGKASIRQRKEETKSHRTRTTFIPAYVLGLLRQEATRQKENRLRAGKLWQNDANLIFTRPDGSPIPHTTVENAYRKIRNAIGHPEFVTHTLRKTHITNEMRAGSSAEAVADSVGHSNPEVTRRHYIDSSAYDDTKQAAAQRRQKEYENRQKVSS